MTIYAKIKETDKKYTVPVPNNWRIVKEKRERGSRPFLLFFMYYFATTAYLL